MLYAGSSQAEIRFRAQSGVQAFVRAKNVNEYLKCLAQKNFANLKVPSHSASAFSFA
jgi:hypothetical protein